jgi:hypothetical protein
MVNLAACPLFLLACCAQLDGSPSPEAKLFSYNANLTQLTPVEGLIEVSLPFENRQDFAVEITEVKVSCSCTKAPAIIGRRLEPGEKATVTFSMAMANLREQATLHASIWGQRVPADATAQRGAHLELGRYQMVVDTVPPLAFAAQSEWFEIVGNESPAFSFRNATDRYLPGLEFRASLAGLSVVTEAMEASALPPGIKQEFRCNLSGFDSLRRQAEKPLRAEVYAMVEVPTQDPEVKVLVAVAKKNFMLRFLSPYALRPGFVAASAGTSTVVLVCGQGNAQIVSEALVVLDSSGAQIPKERYSAEVVNEKWLRLRFDAEWLISRGTKALVFRYEAGSWEESIDVR